MERCKWCDRKIYGGAWLRLKVCSVCAELWTILEENLDIAKKMIEKIGRKRNQQMKNKYTIEYNVCNCHPETCNCNPWKIIYKDKKIATGYFRKPLEKLCRRANNDNS
jgi:hypothetical protein